jgi:hypothetical protein
MKNGNDELTFAAKKLNCDLVSLVAETALWAPPEYIEQMLQERKSVVMYPNIRRKKSDEERSAVIDGIKVDDNVYANTAIKRALGINRKEIEGYDTCHIWPDTCYDERFHTAIPNLVLLPSAIAGLSDFFDDVIRALKFHSFELYGWYPEGEDEPTKPANYPVNWQEPRSFSKEKNTGHNGNKTKDHTQYRFKNEIYGKGRLVLAVIKDFVQNNQRYSYGEIESIFYKKIQGSVGVIGRYEDEKEKYKGKKPKRHFWDDVISLNDDDRIVVSTEWGIENIGRFIKKAEELGYIIEIIL